MDNDLAKRLAWSGLVAASGAIASWVSYKVSTAIWQRVLGEDPPT